MTDTSPYDLEALGVSKNFGSFSAVKEVSFDIPSGSFFSILGPSGCGKTTLMRMIAGFEEPSGGDIRIKGKSVLGTPPNRRNVKMVFQHLALFPMMNVYENIAYGLRCNGVGAAEIKRKVHDVLERIALPDVGEREIHQLSGGQKQRIAIARCMVLGPGCSLARRTARRARPEAARGHEDRAETAAAPVQHHVRLHHARPVRSVGDVG